MNRKRYHSATYIIVDRVGESSGLEEHARRAGTALIQMSMSHWPKHLAQLLAAQFGYRHELLDKEPAGLPKYFRNKLTRVRFENFIRGLSISDESEENQ